MAEYFNRYFYGRLLAIRDVREGVVETHIDERHQLWNTGNSERGSTFSMGPDISGFGASWGAFNNENRTNYNFLNNEMEVQQQNQNLFGDSWNKDNSAFASDDAPLARTVAQRF